MKLNEVTYAIIGADGNVAGDGECAHIGISLESALDELHTTNGRVLGEGPFRVVKVIIAEVIEPGKRVLT